MDYTKSYRELNESQGAAVDTIDGPVLVLAGPGTGKTQLLSIRAGSILRKKKGVSPENILILTYTNSAAKAMKERLAKVMGLEGYDIEVGTFHSFANSIIQESEEAANYVGDKIQMTEVEQVRLIEYIIDRAKGVEEIRPFRAPYLYLDEITRRIGELKRDGIQPKDYAEYLKKQDKGELAYMEDKHIRRLEGLAVVYKMYEELKESGCADLFDERGRYDFDDMILFATKALEEEPELREKYRRLFQYVMVDEYQDTNGAQLELLFTMLDYEDPNLCCVGDDDQSIYRFQGASVGNFKLLSVRYPGTKVLRLKENYRSARELIEISTKIINLIPAEERMAEKALEPMKKYRDKDIGFREFTTEEEELIYIVDKIKALVGRISDDETLPREERSHPYNSIAILVRKRSDIIKIIDALLQAGIPYATDGKEDIAGEFRVKQLLDALELAHLGPADIEVKDLALYKVLTSDYLEIPHIDVLRFISYVNNKRAKEKRPGLALITEFLEYFASKVDEIKFENPKKMDRAAGAIGHLLSDSRTRPVHTLLLDFIKEAGIYKHILKKFDKDNILRIRELRALSSFINMVKAADLASPGIGLDDFMLEMKARHDHGLPVQGALVTMTQDGVRVFTAHGSKGQEFHSVIIPFCLQNRSWPKRRIPDKIPLPAGLFKTKEAPKDRESLKKLFLHDETRLFYVAMTRAKSNLIFTASPAEDAVSSFYLTGLDIQKDSPQYTDESEVLVKSMAMTDAKDPFIGTEAILKDMVGNMSLNPTRLNTYITCKRKFLYNDVLKLPGPKKKSLVFGNCVHKALEETYREYKKAGRFPQFKFFHDAFLKELNFQGVDKSIILHCSSPERVKKLKGWFDLAAKDPVMPIDLEKKLIITVGDGIIFTGKYDKVEWEDEKNKAVRIVDYKTGKPDGHLKAIDACDDLASEECEPYLRQLVAYKLLFEQDAKEAGGRKASHGVLAFIEPVYLDMRKLGYKKGDYVSKRVAIDDEMVRGLEELIKDVWSNVKRLQFEKLPERDKKKCPNCDFDAICWD